MITDAQLKCWFLAEVLPLEPQLTAYILRHWRVGEEVSDIRQDIYERMLRVAREQLSVVRTFGADRGVD